MNSFKFVGKIRPLKEGGYDEHKFTSGWINRTFRFQVLCDGTSQYVQVKGGKWEDDSKNFVSTFLTNEETKKSELAKINWEDRFDVDVVKSVSNFRKFVVDTVSQESRNSLKEKNDLDALEESYENRQLFISAWDYAEALCEFVEGKEYHEDTKFVVKGTFDISYADKDEGRYYRNFSVQKVYVANSDEEEGCFATVDAYFDENSVLEEDENCDTPVNVYLQFYNSSDKKKYFAPMSLLIKGNQENLNGLKGLFSAYSDEVRKVSLLLNLTNKAQKLDVDITEDDLTDEQRSLIEFGLATLESISKEKNQKTVGEKKVENIILNIANSDGAQPTEYEHDDLVLKPGSSKKSKSNSTDTDFDDDDDDLPF